MPNSKIDIEEEKSLMVVNSFVSLMDNHIEFSSNNISDKAVMDWFGRSIFGRASIIGFIRVHVPKCHHKVDEIIRIPHLCHRLLKQTKKTEVKKVPEEQNYIQNGRYEQRTPENPIRLDLEELVKAPRVKSHRWSVDSSDLQFVEIKGSIQYECSFFNEMDTQLVKTKLKKIVLGYSDEIHFIQYCSPMPSCRSNLSQSFRM